MKKTDGSIAIIGAGITGLTLGYYLSQAGYRVTLFEKKEHVGGFLDSVWINGTFLEKYYHHILVGFDDLLKLLEELGMGSEIIWKQAKMGIFHDGKLFSFNGFLDVCLFKPLTFPNRIRFCLGILKMRKMKDRKYLDTFSAEEVLKKYFSEQIWQKIWKPLLKMKFGDDFCRVSATWI